MKIVVTNLSFRDMLLTVNDKTMPSPVHLTCIIGLEEILHEIIYHLGSATRLANLQTITFLVPTINKENKTNIM